MFTNLKRLNLDCDVVSITTSMIGIQKEEMDEGRVMVLVRIGYNSKKHLAIQNRMNRISYQNLIK